MPNKKNIKPNKKETKESYESVKRTDYYLPAFLLLLIVVLGIVAFTIYRLNNDGRRDLLRREAINEIITVIDNLYLENNRYPEAVFFTEEHALICAQVDCLRQEEVALKGSARASVDLSQTTTSKNTKYGYALNNDSYIIGYCDEEGEIQSFGNTEEGSLLLNCN